MSGLIATVPLRHLQTEEIHLAEARHAEMLRALSGLEASQQVRELHQHGALRVGTVKPFTSRLVSRVLQSPDGRTRVFYFGDGRQGDVALQEFLSSDDPSKLQGYFSVLKIETIGESDSATLRVELIRDRRGTLPLAWRRINDVLYVAPRMLALQMPETAPMRNALDFGAAAQMLSSGFIPGTRSLHLDIRYTAPAAVERFESNGVHDVRRYWYYPHVGEEPASSPEDRVHEGIAELEQSMRLNFDDPERTVVFFSGGLDSRVIVNTALRIGLRPDQVNTVSWGAREDIPGSDAYIARQVADRLGLNHRFLAKDIDDYGAAFIVSCRLIDWTSEEAALQPVEWRLLRQLSQQGIHTGLRGDQVFPEDREATSQVDAQMLAAIYQLALQPAWQAVLRPEASAALNQAGEELVNRLIEHPQRYNASELMDRYRFEQEISVQQGAWAKYKIAFLDQRVPFLDDVILEWLPLTTRSDRHRRNLFVRMSEQLDVRLSDIPFATRHSDVNAAHFFHRNGAGRDYCEQALNDRSSRVHELIDPEAMRRFLPDKPAQSVAPIKTSFKRDLKLALSDRLVRHVPHTFARYSYRSRHASLAPGKVVGRYLLLKDFMDQSA